VTHGCRREAQDQDCGSVSNERKRWERIAERRIQLPVRTKSPPSQETLFFDAAALMHHVGGDRELLREIVEIFLATAPQMLADVRGAVVSDDCQKVEQAAHALRGAAGNFFSASVEQAALALEAMGRSRDLADAKSAFGALAAELDKLRSLLELMLRGEPA
jgi:HPt (histidine-containing phosphotransfer) domain-containing protein